MLTLVDHFVRLASLEDLPEIMQIDAKAFKHSPCSEASWVKNITEGKCLVVGTVKGFAVVHPDFDRCLISKLAVSARYRRSGVGAALLLHVIRNNPGKVHLIVGVDNAAAITMYEKFGFAVEEEIPGLEDTSHYFMVR